MCGLQEQKTHVIGQEIIPIENPHPISMVPPGAVLRGMDPKKVEEVGTFLQRWTRIIMVPNMSNNAYMIDFSKLFRNLF